MRASPRPIPIADVAEVCFENRFENARHLSSANTQRCDGWCQEILVVETTQHGIRAYGKTLAQAMSGSGTEDAMRCRGRIRDTGTQGHMWTCVIVMGNPR